MFSMLRTKFGIPGVIAVVALVFAMLGGAYAATNSSGGKATASAKGKRGPRGPRGATGPVGPQGLPGTNGKDGSPGTPGSNGANGKSVASTEFGPTEEPAAEPCEERGGTEFVSGEDTVTYACNGEEGSPWTAAGTLPPNATETGAWTFSGKGFEFGGTTFNGAAASFTIPLAEALGGSHLHFITGASTTECPGTTAEPAAAAGEFCAYSEGAPFQSTFLELESVGTSGVRFTFETTGAAASGSGSWAVTAAP